MKINLFAQCLGYKKCSTNYEGGGAADDDDDNDNDDNDDDDNDDNDLGDPGDDEKGESKNPSEFNLEHYGNLLQVGSWQNSEVENLYSPCMYLLEPLCLYTILP